MDEKCMWNVSIDIRFRIYRHNKLLIKTIQSSYTLVKYLFKSRLHSFVAFKEHSPKNLNLQSLNPRWTSVKEWKIRLNYFLSISLSSIDFTSI